MKGFFVILITSLLLSWIKGLARTAKARRKRGATTYPPVLPVELVYTVVTAMAVWFIWAGWTGPAADREVVALGGFGFLIFALITWPKAISISGDGLAQRS